MTATSTLLAAAILAQPLLVATLLCRQALARARVRVRVG